MAERDRQPVARVIVETYDLASGELLYSKAMPLTRANAQWLIKTLTWAVNHGKGIQVFNIKDKASAERPA